MKGVPVVVSTNGRGVPVISVTKNAPKLTVASNGKGFPIILVTKNAPPFVVVDEAGNPVT